MLNRTKVSIVKDSQMTTKVQWVKAKMHFQLVGVKFDEEF